jgi:hypothetical protein
MDDELHSDIQDFLDSRNVTLISENEAIKLENPDTNFETYFELDCQLCGGDCKGHLYTDDTGYIT